MGNWDITKPNQHPCLTDIIYDCYRMTHSYLLLTNSPNYEGKLLIGTSATSFNTHGEGLTDKSIRDVKIPSSFDGKEIAEIGFRAFSNTNINSVFIPKTIIAIYNSAFAGCYYLIDVKFEEGSILKKLDSDVFYSCISIKKIDFPASLTSISVSSTSNFFNGAPLECISYAGIQDFSSLTNFFSGEPKIYVTKYYQGISFAGSEIIRGNTSCGVSWDILKNPKIKKSFIKCSYVIKRINIQYQNYMFLLIHNTF